MLCGIGFDQPAAESMSRARCKELVNRCGTNKPKLRQQQILSELRKRFVGTEQIEFSTMSAAARAAAVQSYGEDFIVTFEGAWQSARCSGDSHWFEEDEQKLTPLHFPKSHPMMAANLHKVNIPLYKRLAFYSLDRMTPIYKESFEHSMLSLTNTLEMTSRAFFPGELATDDENRESETNPLRVWYACNSIPGHHSDPYVPIRGYCFINHAAVAAQWILQQNSKAKISILDLDCHAGDGTQWFFFESDSVLTQSIHMGAHEYPSFSGDTSEVGAGVGVNFNVNYPCPPRTGWPQYKLLLEAALLRHNQHEPDAMIITFGSDTYCLDPDVTDGSGFDLQVEDYRSMGALIRSLHTTCPILITQEGGYDVTEAGNIVSTFLEGLCPASCS